jgi:hypothetical protein
MNDRQSHDSLLNDVLGEVGPAGLREALLSRTLRLAKRRRMVRHARRVGSAIALLVALGFVCWPLVPRSRSRAYVLVRTQPVSIGTVVESRPFSAARVVASAPNVAVVSTGSGPGGFQEIDDAELLAFATPRPAVLVRLGPEMAELIFAPTEEEE